MRIKRKCKATNKIKKKYRKRSRKKRGGSGSGTVKTLTDKLFNMLPGGILKPNNPAAQHPQIMTKTKVQRKGMNAFDSSSEGLGNLITVPCNEKQIKKNGNCEDCPGNKIPNLDKTSCRCPDDFVDKEGKCVKDDLIIGFGEPEKELITVTCENNQIKKNGNCEDCPGNKIPNNDKTDCICPKNMVLNLSGNCECKYPYIKNIKVNDGSCLNINKEFNRCEKSSNQDPSELKFYEYFDTYLDEYNVSLRNKIKNLNQAKKNTIKEQIITELINEHTDENLDENLDENILKKIYNKIIEYIENKCLIFYVSTLAQRLPVYITKATTSVGGTVLSQSYQRSEHSPSGASSTNKYQYIWNRIPSKIATEINK